MIAGTGGGMILQISQAIFYQIFPPGQRGLSHKVAQLWALSRVMPRTAAKTRV